METCSDTSHRKYNDGIKHKCDQCDHQAKYEFKWKHALQRHVTSIHEGVELKLLNVIIVIIRQPLDGA
jgi:hypothetical protein